MHRIFERMQEFPTGSWDIADCDQFTEWARELASIPGSASLREAITSIRNFSIALGNALLPVEFDEEPSDDNDADPDSSYTPAAKTRPTRPSAAASSSQTTDDVVVNDPKVSSISSVLRACSPLYFSANTATTITRNV